MPKSFRLIGKVARIGRNVKKVFASQVIVTTLDAGIDASRLDGNLKGRVFDFHRVQLDFGVPLVEMSMSGNETRLGHEIDLTVRVVNDVWPRLGAHGDSCQDEQNGKQKFFHTVLVLIRFSTSSGSERISIGWRLIEPR